METHLQLNEKIINDFLALELRHKMSALAEITGDEITSKDL